MWLMTCKWFVVIEDEKYLEVDAKTNDLFWCIWNSKKSSLLRQNTHLRVFYRFSILWRRILRAIAILLIDMNRYYFVLIINRLHFLHTHLFMRSNQVNCNRIHAKNRNHWIQLNLIIKANVNFIITKYYKWTLIWNERILSVRRI